MYVAINLGGRKFMQQVFGGGKSFKKAMEQGISAFFFFFFFKYDRIIFEDDSSWAGVFWLHIRALRMFCENKL